MSKNKEISLPVTPFVYAVLTSQYGSDYIRVNQKQNKSLAILCQVSPRFLPKKRIDELTESVTLQISDSLYKHLSKQDLNSLGLLWHRQFLHVMYSFIEAQVLAGRPAYESLSAYFAEHGIGEDIWSHDSAYRAWTTYKSEKKKVKPHKFSENRQRKRAFSVIEKFADFKAEFRDPILSAELIESIVFDFFSCDASVYAPSVQSPDSVLIVRKSLFYIIHHLCGHSCARIGRRTGVPARSVRHHVNSEMKPVIFAQVIKCALHTLKVLRTQKINVLLRNARA